MRIRLATDADLAGLQRIYDERLALLTQGDRRIRADVVRWLNRDYGSVWVGESNGEIAGYISVWWSDGLWLIDHMALDTHTYHPGLARALVAVVREAAQLQNSGRILINIPSYDPVEQAFWRALGAKKADRHGHPGYQWMQVNL